MNDVQGMVANYTKFCERPLNMVVAGISDSLYWVEKMGRIYLAAKRSEEWRRYLEELINKHHRKRSLRPHLEALRGLK